MISNSGHDENGRYSGGAAGDQTGGEWAIINWYNRPWNVVLRHPDASVREMIAKIAEAAARNEKIGYDQNQRTTYWAHLAASGYDPAKITVACEADCSAGVAANVKAAGYRLGIQKLKDVSIYCYTGNLRNALVNAGFQALTDPKYLTSDQYLLRGDILLYENHHTATNLTNGSKATVPASKPASGVTAVPEGLSQKVKYDAVAKVKITPKTWAGEKADNMKTVKSIAKGDSLGICQAVNDEEGVKWYYVKIVKANKYGFVPASKVKKVATKSDPTALNEAIQYDGQITATTLNIRTWAGTENPTLQSHPYLKKGTVVGVCDTVKDSVGDKWYYIEYKGKHGFAYAKYIKKI